VSVGMLDEDDELDGVPAPYDDEPADEPEPSMPAGEPEAPVAPPAEREPEPEAFADDDLEVEERDEPAPPPQDAGEDVLEETPDFLQETPEHDRLWFEQKPPRDFEF
jgi:hypothetical protein